jgi:3-oxoacyl-[acyl-carrier protein] reductase
MPSQRDQSLDGLAAVVTGSSSGIGRAIAVELAHAGSDVLVHCRQDRAGADETATRIRSLARQSHVVLADLNEPSQQDRLADTAWEWRAIDIWVNNAGADVLTGPAAHAPFDEKLAALWCVDVVATVRLSRNIGARMKRRGQGVIINVGWDQAETGMAGDSGELFATAKGAVMAATRSLARSLAPEVRVNCVAPGWIRTAWGEQASEDWQALVRRQSLLGRWGEPEDVARVVQWLASPAAALVNAQVININGGRDMVSDIPR